MAISPGRDRGHAYGSSYLLNWLVHLARCNLARNICTPGKHTWMAVLLASFPLASQSPKTVFIHIYERRMKCEMAKTPAEIEIVR